MLRQIKNFCPSSKRLKNDRESAILTLNRFCPETGVASSGSVPYAVGVPGPQGYTGDIHCKGCGGIVEKGTAIKATGEHAYGEWRVVVAPTATTKGEKQRVCSACDHVGFKEIPMLSHTPATGDDSHIMLYGAAFMVSLTGIAVFLAARKRKQENA